MHSRYHSRCGAVGVLFALALTVFLTDPFGRGRSDRAFAELTPASPEVKAAVQKGLQFLRDSITQGASGHRSFSAATMMRAGVSPDDPLVKAELQRILDKFNDGNYSKVAGSNEFNNNYTPATDLMALCIAQRWELERNGKQDAYTYQIETVIDFLLSKQNPGGDWDYFDRPSGQGDTSQVQFVLLGLWSATDEGFDVPPHVFEFAANWLLKTQFENGGFSYHPLGPKDHGVEHGTTVAGVSGLLIAGIHLYSQKDVGKNTAAGKDAANQAADPKESPFEAAGAEEEVRADGTAKATKKKRSKQGAGGKSVSLDQINQAANKGIAYLADDYKMASVERFDLYYRYGIERMTALRRMQKLGDHDWYEDGASLFLKEQADNGSWMSPYDGPQAGTCFAILFLTRATWNKTKPPPPPDSLGKGQMIANRGQIDPKNPGTFDENGALKRQEPTGPLEDFLNDLLKNPDSKIAPELGQKIIDDYKANPEKRAELIGQKDKLKQLVEIPNDDARIAALWALGRCEDLGLAPLMIKALGDNNIDVSVEARNALCVLSRRPLGEGLAAHPWADLPEDASEQQKHEEFLKWRGQALERWKLWYARVRPYDQRDDLSDLGTN